LAIPRTPLAKASRLQTPHLLVVPAERFPTDESFVEEVLARSEPDLRTTILFRATKFRDDYPESWGTARIAVLSPRPRVLGSFAVYFFDPRVALRIFRIARNARVDAVLARDQTLPLFLALVGRPWKRWKVLYQRTYPHETSWFEPARVSRYRLPWLHVLARRVEWAILKRLLPHADAILPISAAMGEDMTRDGLCPPDRVHPFGMGVSRAILELDPPTQRSPGDPLRLAYVGTMAPERGLPRLLEAVRIVREQAGIDARLTMYGGTPNEIDSLTRERDRQGLAEFVELPGYVDRANLYSLLRGHDAGAVFVARDPRYRIASTTKLIESLALGMPCVATDAVSMHFDLAEQSQAMVITDDTADGFARGIVELEENWAGLADSARGRRREVYALHAYESARRRLVAVVHGLSSDREQR
jgi:glycosyltransferase involved in cell wall biosynthesis